MRLRVGGGRPEGNTGRVKFKLILAGAGALLLGGIGIGASAYSGGLAVPFLAAAKPSPSPGAERNAACTDFLNHLASNLGISQSKLRSALQKSADQTIDDAVAAGKLTADQAAKIKARMAGGAACNFRPGAGFERPHRAAMGEVIKAAAETLNLTPEQLMTDVRNGQSLSSLAHGMTEDQFRTAFLGHLKTDLDALVKQGKLTSAQESSMLQKMQNAPIPFWNSGFKLPDHGGGWSGYPPMSPASPAATAGT